MRGVEPPLSLAFLRQWVSAWEHGQQFETDLGRDGVMRNLVHFCTIFFFLHEC